MCLTARCTQEQSPKINPKFVPMQGLGLKNLRSYCKEAFAHCESSKDDQGAIGDTIKDVSEIVEKVNDVFLQLQNTVQHAKSIVQFDDNDNLLDNLVARFEHLIVLLFQLNSASSWSAVGAALISFWQSCNPGTPFCKSLAHFLYEFSQREGDTFFDARMEDQGSAHDVWTQLTEGVAGESMSRLVNMAIIFGFLPNRVESKVAKELYEVLRVQERRKMDGSVISNTIKCLEWLFECLIPAISSGDWSLLYGDAEIQDLDKLYRTCLGCAELIVTGQEQLMVERYEMSTDSEALVYINNAILAHEQLLRRFKKDRSMSNMLNNRLIKLDKISSDIQQHWLSSGLREKPFSVLVRGSTSVGKSLLCNIVNDAIFHACGFPIGKEYTCYLNGSDEYQSEWRPQHLSAIFDDKGQTKAERETKNPLFVLIQFINNMHCSALSPIAERKGNNAIRAKIVIVSTNTTDLHAHWFSVNAASIMRRFDVVIDVGLREDCKNELGSPHPRFLDQLQPDMWDLKVQNVVVKRSRDDFTADKWHLVPAIEGKNVCNIYDLIQHIGKVAPQHMEHQRQLVANSENLMRAARCETHPLICMSHGECPACKQNQAGEEEDVFYDLAPSDDVAVDNSANFLDRVVEFVKQFKINGLKETLLNLYRRMEDKVKDGLAKHYKAFLVVLGSFALCFKLSRALKGDQGNLESFLTQTQTPQQIVDRQDVFRQVHYPDPYVPKASSTGTFAHLENHINKNLMYVKITEYDPYHRKELGKTFWCNTFPISKARYVLPKHMLPGIEEGKKYLVAFHQIDKIGSKRWNEIVTRSTTRVFDKDMVVIEAKGGGDTTPLEKYFRESVTDNHVKIGDPVVIYRLKRDGTNPIESKVCTRITNVGRELIGQRMKYGYEYECDNFPGMCGALVVTNTPRPIILGFHTSGNVSTKMCHATPIYRGELFEERVGVKVCDTVPLPKSFLGVDVEVSPGAKDKHPINFFEDDGKDYNLSALGSHSIPSGRFTSSIVKAPTYDGMVAIGVDDVYGPPPKSAAKKSLRRHMVEGTEVLPPCDPDILELAKRDFIAKIDQQLLNNKELISDLLKPIDLETAINGVPGVVGFDGINPTSSSGFAKNMSKNKLVKETLDINGHPIHFKQENFVEIDGQVHYVYLIEFDPEKLDIEMLVDHLITCALKGERACAAFRCCLKDEVLKMVKIAEGKIRVFASAPVDFVILTRMVTLPLANLIYQYPTVFEQAVRVNAEGRDWAFMEKILTDMDPDRCGDGDYGSFDLKIRPAFMLAAFDILRHVLQRAGASAEQLSILDLIATECTYPIYEIDGLLYEGYGTNPSGNGLTVLLNGLIGCLNMRYAYYSFYSNEKPGLEFGDIPLFHVVVALLVYGDDNIFSVSPKEENFNLGLISRELAKIGHKYTGADKKVIEGDAAFKSICEISFLKRTFHHHPQLNETVGPLEEASIMRPLLWTRKVKKEGKSQAEICAANMKNALWEFFLHSQEKCDHYRPLFQKIAEETVDDEGFRVIDFYDKVPTNEDFVARFQSTYSSYEAALDLLKEDQCGEEFQPLTEDYLSHCIEKKNGIYYDWEPYAQWFAIFFLSALRTQYNTHRLSYRMPSPAQLRILVYLFFGCHYTAVIGTFVLELIVSRVYPFVQNTISSWTISLLLWLMDWLPVLWQKMRIWWTAAKDAMFHIQEKLNQGGTDDWNTVFATIKYKYREFPISSQSLQMKRNCVLGRFDFVYCDEFRVGWRRLRQFYAGLHFNVPGRREALRDYFRIFRPHLSRSRRTVNIRNFFEEYSYYVNNNGVIPMMHELEVDFRFWVAVQFDDTEYDPDLWNCPAHIKRSMYDVGVLISRDYRVDFIENPFRVTGYTSMLEEILYETLEQRVYRVEGRKLLAKSIQDMVHFACCDKSVVIPAEHRKAADIFVRKRKREVIAAMADVDLPNEVKEIIESFNEPSREPLFLGSPLEVELIPFHSNDPELIHVEAVVRYTYGSSCIDGPEEEFLYNARFPLISEEGLEQHCTDIVRSVYRIGEPIRPLAGGEHESEWTGQNAIVLDDPMNIG